MKNDKSPGSDGRTKEFYVCFFNEVSNILITAFKHSFTTGSLSTSQREAVITLIEKKDKEIYKNWRPISSINVDTKIASKALAVGMENVLTSIVHCNQTAYVKGRYIGESIRLIRTYCSTQKNTVLVEFCFLQILRKPLTPLNTHLFSLHQNLSVLAPSLFSVYELFLGAPRVAL